MALSGKTPRHLLIFASLSVSIVSATLFAESSTHEVVLTSLDRVTLALSLIEDVVQRPEGPYLDELLGIIPEGERGQFVDYIEDLRVAGSADGAGSVAPPIITFTRSVNSGSGDFTFKYRVASEAAPGYVAFDSGVVTFQVNQGALSAKGVPQAFKKSASVTRLAGDYIKTHKELRPLQRQSSLVIADYNSPHLFIESNISNTFNYPRFTSTKSQDAFNKQIYSQPRGIFGIRYVDSYASGFSCNYLVTTDRNWDRIVSFGDPVGDNNEFVKSTCSHGNGSYGLSYPSDVDFMGFKLIVADAYNKRVQRYSISTTNGDLSLIQSVSGSFGLPIDVAAMWWLDPIQSGSSSNAYGQFAVLDQSARRVSIYTDAGALSKNLNAYDFGTQSLLRPTSVCYGRNIINNFDANYLYVVDDSAKRVVSRPTANTNWVFSTNSGSFPQNSYLTSIDCDFFGRTVFVVDQNNSKIQAFSSGLGTKIAEFGGQGSGVGQLDHPQCINVMTGWEAGQAGTPVTPLALGDALVTERYGASTGIRKYVMGYDVLAKEMKYTKGAPSERGDNVVVNWFQTGWTRSTVKLYRNAYFNLSGQTADAPFYTEYTSIRSPGMQGCRFYFDSTCAESFCSAKIHAVVELEGLFLPTLQARVLDSLTIQRQFYSPPEHKPRIIVEDCGVAEASNGQEVTKIYGYTKYMFWQKPKDMRMAGTPIWKLWYLNASKGSIGVEPNGPFTPINSPGAGIYTLRDTVYISFEPQTWYAGEMTQVVSCRYSKENNSTSAFEFCESGHNMLYCGDSVSTSPPTSGSQTVCWYQCNWFRPFYCSQDGFSCPTPPGGCPFVFVWNNDDFEFLNNILPQSEYLSDSAGLRSDWYPIYSYSLADSNHYKLRISEDESEITTFDKVELLQFDLPEPAKLTFNDHQEIVALSDETIEPVAAMTFGGLNILPHISAADNGNYVEVDPGYIDLTYVIPPDTTPGSLSEVKLTSGGGLAPPPPSKNEMKQVAGYDPDENIYLIGAFDDSGVVHEVDTIPARVIPQGVITDLSNYIYRDTLRVRLEWTRNINIDYLPYLKYRRLGVTPYVAPLVSATHTTLGAVTDRLTNTGDSTATLSQGQGIDFLFEAAPRPDSMRRALLLHVVGRYQTSGSTSGSGPDSTSGPQFSQNYPNPFNPTTSFKFTLPKATPVTLEVYNILGQKVVTVVDQTMDPGEHVVTWNGKDSNGQMLASGVYFAKMKAGSYSESRKMVIAK